MELWEALALLWYKKRKIEVENKLNEYIESIRRNNGIDNENLKLEEMRDLVMKAIQNEVGAIHLSNVVSDILIVLINCAYSL